MSRLVRAIKKSIRPDLDTVWERIWLSDKMDWFWDRWYGFIGLFTKLRRSWDYAKFGFNNYDFDALTIENYLLFKLRRVEKALIDGHADLTNDDAVKYMKALRLTIKLLDRLTNDDFNRFDEMHEAKWGELQTHYEKASDDFGGSYIHFSRPNATSPKEVEQERKESMAASAADAREEKRARKLVYLLINKYIRMWWD